MAIQRKKRRDSTANLSSFGVIAQGVFGFDTTLKEPVYGDDASVGGVPGTTFETRLKQRYTLLTATQNGSPEDPNDLTVSVDSRFANFLTGGTIDENLRFTFKAPANNTGAVDLTVDWSSGDSGPKNLKKISGGSKEELAADDLVSGAFYECVYDGTEFLLLSGVGGGGGTWELVESKSFSGVASVDFTSGLDATGNAYLFEFSAVQPATDAADLEMQLSTDGGSSWLGGNRANTINASSTASTVSNNDQNNAAQMTLAQALGNQSGESAKGFVELYDPASASSLKTVQGIITSIRAAVARLSIPGGTVVDSDPGDTAAVNAVRFQMSSGNMSGRITMYRRKFE